MKSSLAVALVTASLMTFATSQEASAGLIHVPRTVVVAALDDPVSMNQATERQAPRLDAIPFLRLDGGLIRVFAPGVFFSLDLMIRNLADEIHASWPTTNTIAT